MKWGHVLVMTLALLVGGTAVFANTQIFDVLQGNSVVAAGSVTTPTVTSTADVVINPYGATSPAFTFSNFFGAGVPALFFGAAPSSSGEYIYATGGILSFNSGPDRFQLGNGHLYSAPDLGLTVGYATQRMSEVWSSRYAGVEQAVAGAATITVNPASGEAVQITLATCPTTVNGAAGDPNEEMTTYWRQPTSGSTCTPSGFATGTNGFSFAGSASFTATLSKMDLYTWKWDATSSVWREKSRSLNLTQ